MSGKLYRGFRGLPGYLLLGVVLLALCTVLAACQSPSAPTPEPEQTTETQLKYVGKKIVWVDSYHEGYEWSDGVEAGIRGVLDGTGVELKIVRMDTLRNTGDEFGNSAAEKAKAEIETFEPDVVIASDDNAQKYLIVPYFKDKSLPVVFCGVNWDASVYGYPTDNVTGMVEVELAVQIFENLKRYARGDRVGYLGPDITTERKISQAYNQRFFNGEMKVRWVNTFDEFKEAFPEIQEEVDVLYIGNNAGIEGWDDEEAESFVVENTRVPTGVRTDWMAPYALIALAKKSEEQGEWAAQAALRILDGTPISEIPVAENKEGRLILNLNIAEKMDVVFPPSMLKNAEIYGSGEGS
jgi:hypothetical protein